MIAGTVSPIVVHVLLLLLHVVVVIHDVADDLAASVDVVVVVVKAQGPLTPPSPSTPDGCPM